MKRKYTGEKQPKPLIGKDGFGESGYEIACCTYLNGDEERIADIEGMRLGSKRDFDRLEKWLIGARQWVIGDGK
jgi:hypothetical protein